MTAVLGWRTPGGRTVATTLGHMRQLVNQDVERPALWELAPRLVREVDGRDYQAQAALLYRWVEAHTRFVRDPLEAELLRTPAFMLAEIVKDGIAPGDCDDIAMLSAALGKAIGFQARFVAEGYGLPADETPFVHVYTIISTPDGWRGMDTTRPRSAATAIPTRRLTVEV